MDSSNTGLHRKPSQVLCPSARCQEGAYVVGIVGPDGTVGYLSPLLQVDGNFAAAAHVGRAPEGRFRFAQPCVESGCVNWEGARCGVIDRAMVAKSQAEANLGELNSGLPRCSIRRWCRWFGQAGADACVTCPLVITDTPKRPAADGRSSIRGGLASGSIGVTDRKGP
jgi:hypothetical protein